jgi:hypothetical protein
MNNQNGNSMEKSIIKPRITITQFTFISLFLCAFGILFTFFGLDFSRVECANSNCKVYYIYGGFIESSPQHIKRVETVLLNERYSSSKDSHTLVTNVLLKSKDNTVNVFNSYSNMNKIAKEDALMDLNDFIEKRIRNIDKTYGGITPFFYIGLFILIISIYMFYKSTVHISSKVKLEKK